MAILIKILNRAACNTGLHGGFDNRHRYALKEAWIEGFRNNVVGAKLQRLTVIGLCHFFRRLLLSKVDKAIRTGKFHLVVNRGRTTIQCATEQEGEAEDVIYLVWKVRPACANNGVWPGLASKVWVNLRIWIGHRQNQGVGRHLLKHVLSDTVTGREAKEYVGAFHGLG